MSECFKRFFARAEAKKVISVAENSEDVPCGDCKKYQSVAKLCKLRGHVFAMETGCFCCKLYKAHLVDCLGCKKLGKLSE